MGSYVFRVGITRQRSSMSCWYCVLGALLGSAPSVTPLYNKYKDDEGLEQGEVDTIVLTPECYEGLIGRVPQDTIRDHRGRWTTDLIRRELLQRYGPIWVTYENGGFTHAMLLYGVHDGPKMRQRYVYILDPTKKYRPRDDGDDYGRRDRWTSETGGVLVPLATFNGDNFAHNEMTKSWANYMMYRRAHNFRLLDNA